MKIVAGMTFLEVALRKIAFANHDRYFTGIPWVSWVGVFLRME